MRRVTTCILSTFALVAAFYLGLWIADRNVSARIATLKSELRAPDRISDPSVYWMVRARLTAIDAYLDQHAKAREGFAVPAMWGPEHRADLEEGFESLGSFFEQVDSLLDDDTCRFALAHGEIVSDLGPMLSLSRHRTNVLCARALTEFEGPDGSRLAARRLGQALDLIRLGDDGRDLSYLISATEEDRVLSALRRLLADERADGSAFRRELDDRLERISRDDRVESVLSNSVAEYVEYERGHSESSWAKPWSRYEQCRERNRVSEGLATSVQLARTTGVNSRALYLSKLGATDNPAWVNGWMATADGSHMHQVRLDLARRALALAADGDTPGAPPVDRFTGGIFEERATDHGIELCAQSAMAALNVQPSDPQAYLLDWTIPR